MIFRPLAKVIAHVPDSLGKLLAVAARIVLCPVFINDFDECPAHGAASPHFERILLPIMINKH